MNCLWYSGQISNGEVPLPGWFQPCGKDEAAAKGVAAEGAAAEGAVAEGAAAEGAAAEGAEGVDGGGAPKTGEPLVEVQAVLDKKSHDTWENLEVAPPKDLLDTNEWVMAWREKREAEAPAEVGAEADAEAGGASAEAGLGAAAGEAAPGSSGETVKPAAEKAKPPAKKSQVAPAPAISKAAKGKPAYGKVASSSLSAKPKKTGKVSPAK